MQRDGRSYFRPRGRARNAAAANLRRECAAARSCSSVTVVSPFFKTWDETRRIEKRRCASSQLLSALFCSALVRHYPLHTLATCVPCRSSRLIAGYSLREVMQRATCKRTGCRSHADLGDVAGVIGTCPRHRRAGRSARTRSPIQCRRARSRSLDAVSSCVQSITRGPHRQGSIEPCPRLPSRSHPLGRSAV